MAAIVTTPFAMWLIHGVKSIRISAYLTLFMQYLNLRGGFCWHCHPARKWRGPE